MDKFNPSILLDNKSQLGNLRSGKRDTTVHIAKELRYFHMYLLAKKSHNIYLEG